MSVKAILTEQQKSYTKAEEDALLANYYNKDYIDTYMAPLDTPTFIGTPKAPTAAAGTNTTQIATTAFVEQAKNTRVPVIGKGVNLLRNWYFVGGGTGRGVFPINQRGLTSYISPSGNRTIDGWLIRTSGSSVVIDSNYITFNRGETNERADFYQLLGNNLLQKIYGKYVTLSLLLGDGRFLYSSFIWSSSSITRIEQSDFIFNAGNGPTYGSDFSTFFLRLTGASLNIIAIKLERGTEQTLCHNEGTDANPVWVLNEVPDYEEELIKCKTSTADSSDAYANKSLATEQQLASVETGTTTSRAYAVGEYFCWNGLSYRVTVAINSGGTITPGTNCELSPLSTMLQGMNIDGVSVPSGSTLTITFPSTGSRANGLLSITGNGVTRIALYAFSGMNGITPSVARISGADLDSLFSTTTGKITFTPNYGASVMAVSFNNSGRIEIS